jgi:multimeric flavodoxin WrbA
MVTLPLITTDIMSRLRRAYHQTGRYFGACRKNLIRLSVFHPVTPVPFNLEREGIMRILGVSGSPRRRGNSDLILDSIMEGTGADSEIIYLSDMDFSSCVGCERCRKEKVCTRFEDDLTPLYEKIRESMGIVLVSPVYNYNITSWMKAFIDRMYCFYDFDDDRPRGWSCRLAGQGRAAALAIVGEQMGEEDLGVTMEALRMPVKKIRMSSKSALNWEKTLP